MHVVRVPLYAMQGSIHESTRLWVLGRIGCVFLEAPPRWCQHGHGHGHEGRVATYLGGQSGTQVGVAALRECVAAIGVRDKSAHAGAVVHCLDWL